MRNNSFISSFKLALKRLISIAVLIAGIVSIFYKYMEITQYSKDEFFDFYRHIDKDTVDVLCVGSSHMYCGINPVQMWDDYGVAAYDLACGSQSIWFSYHYIKEALKTQHPEIVILDVYTLPFADEYFDTKIESNLLGMPLSYNKWEALEAASAENKIDYFLQFPVFHSRYNSLVKYNFNLDNNGNQKFLGYYYTEQIVAYEKEDIIDIRNVKECEPISHKTEEYLRKSIELCQENNIDIILTNTPWPNITEEMQKKYNYIQQIADEYDVIFWNGCLFNEEIGMDYSVDSMGDDGHLNYMGVTKYTRWLTERIKENYDLPDRRADARWAEWNRQSDKLKAAMRKNKLAQINDIGEYLKCIENEDSIYYIIALNGVHRDEITEDSIIDILISKGIDTDQNGAYVINCEEQLLKTDSEGYKWWHYFDDSVLYIYEREGKPVISWDRWECALVNQGINIVVYDEALDEIVGRIGFDAENGYEVVK